VGPAHPRKASKRVQKGHEKHMNFMEMERKRSGAKYKTMQQAE
jgi:hypothetical protein